jgi:hypothetical protein
VNLLFCRSFVYLFIITPKSNRCHRPLPPLNPGPLPPTYFDLGESSRGHVLSVRDPDVELAAQASASVAVPELPPPELTKSGKPLTKRERKAVGTIFRSDPLASSVTGLPSSGTRLRGQTGLIYPLQRKRISRDCTAKWKHFVFAISLTRSASIGEMREKAKVSKACRNILPCVPSSHVRSSHNFL